jgi:hypothetical protein
MMEPDLNICKLVIKHLYEQYGSSCILLAVADVIPQDQLEPDRHFEVYEGESY